MLVLLLINVVIQVEHLYLQVLMGMIDGKVAEVVVHIHLLKVLLEYQLL